MWDWECQIQSWVGYWCQEPALGLWLGCGEVWGQVQVKATPEVQELLSSKVGIVKVRDYCVNQNGQNLLLCAVPVAALTVFTLPLGKKKKIQTHKNILVGEGLVWSDLHVRAAAPVLWSCFTPS